MASSSEVRDFVYRIIDLFPGYLSSPARWIADRIFGIWNEIYAFLVLLPDAFKFARERMHLFWLSIVEHANQVAQTFRWLVDLFVPRWARWALNTALTLLRQEAVRLSNFLQGIINTLRRWAQTAIATVSKYAHDAWNWAAARISEVWATLRHVRDLALRFLTSPTVLVDWLFAALWQRLWRYIDAHAEAIAFTWWQRRNTLIMKALTRFETFLERIL